MFKRIRSWLLALAAVSSVGLVGSYAAMAGDNYPLAIILGIVAFGADLGVVAAAAFSLS